MIFYLICLLESWGLGLVSSSNIGSNTAHSEPVHGSALGMAGKGKANPLAMSYTIAFMLEYLGSVITIDDELWSRQYQYSNQQCIISTITEGKNLSIPGFIGLCGHVEI